MSNNAPKANPDSSLSAMLSTLTPAASYAVLYLILFFILRQRFPRYYSPRSVGNSLPAECRSPQPRSGCISWLIDFFRLDDSHVLHHHSLDGFLFLRLLKVSVIICVVGCIITWPILLPINATGGGEQTGLNLLTIGNCTDNFYKYFAHAGCAIIFFSFVLWMITHETVYLINLRQAYLMSPLHASRISSRTVLFASVPRDYMNKDTLNGMLGPGVRNIWFVTHCKELIDQVARRDKIALQLEEAEIHFHKAANFHHSRHNQTGSLREPAHKKWAWTDCSPLRLMSRNIKATNAREKSHERALDTRPLSLTQHRPTHRRWRFVGSKIDTIDWCRDELQNLIPSIEALQTKHKAGQARMMNSAFVEFDDLARAQEAFQMLTHHQALHMAPRFTGMTPAEVIWTNLYLDWRERVMRGIAAAGLVLALVLFWAVPIAAIGTLSNLTALQNRVRWVRFVNDLPPQVLGVLTGLLPVLLLAVLLALVPIVMRVLARLHGVPTRSAAELLVHKWFFFFLVVQGFLVTTFASSATAVVTHIVADPRSALLMLSQNLPKASNFYINYFIIKGLGGSSSILLDLAGLLTSLVLGTILDTTPRKKYTRWKTLPDLCWGTLFPNVEILAVIAICYAGVAPLVLGSAAMGLALLYTAQRYHLLFMSNADVDCKGLLYAHALQHLFVGLYIAEACMIALFAIGTGNSIGAVGPLVLMTIMLVVTVLYHINLNASLRPLLSCLPKSVTAEEKRLQRLRIGNDAALRATANLADRDDCIIRTGPSAIPFQGQRFGLWRRSMGFFDCNSVCKRFATSRPITYTAESAANAFHHPAITSKPPLLWIANDDSGLGLSKETIAGTQDILPITDEGAYIDLTQRRVVWGDNHANPGADAGSEPTANAPIAERIVQY